MTIFTCCRVWIISNQEYFIIFNRLNTLNYFSILSEGCLARTICPTSGIVFPKISNFTVSPSTNVGHIESPLTTTFKKRESKVLHGLLQPRTYYEFLLLHPLILVHVVLKLQLYKQNIVLQPARMCHEDSGLIQDVVV